MGSSGLGSSGLLGSLGSLLGGPGGGGKLVGCGKFPKLKPFGRFPDFTTGSSRLQAESKTPFTTSLATLKTPPRKPPPFGFGSGLQTSLGRFIFTTSTPWTFMCGNMSIFVILGISASVIVTSFSSENCVGRMHPNNAVSVQNKSAILVGSEVGTGVWPQNIDN